MFQFWVVTSVDRKDFLYAPNQLKISVATADLQTASSPSMLAVRWSERAAASLADVFLAGTLYLDSASV